MQTGRQEGKLSVITGNDLVYKNPKEFPQSLKTSIRMKTLIQQSCRIQDLYTKLTVSVLHNGQYENEIKKTVSFIKMSRIFSHKYNLGNERDTLKTIKYSSTKLKKAHVSGKMSHIPGLEQ